jgi:hypothetical protein
MGNDSNDEKLSEEVIDATLADSFLPVTRHRGI